MTPDKLLERAQQLLFAGQPHLADTICRQLLITHPDSHRAYFQLALIAVHSHSLPGAAEALKAAIRHAPRNAIYHRTLCEVYRRMGCLPEAIASGQAAVGINPRDAEARYNLGLTLADTGAVKEAIWEYRAALRLKPSHSFAANNLGSALEASGDVKAATAAYRRAVTHDPFNAEAQNNLGAILTASGELDTARAHFEAAIHANSGFIEAHHNLSGLKQYAEGDPHLMMLETLEPKAGALPTKIQVKYWFAIGKARHDVGRHEQAMQAFDSGNHLMRQSIRYDDSRTCKAFERQIDMFRSELSHITSGMYDTTPIFIVGMPRSGTTLIEQVLASHPSVRGAGELTLFNDVASNVIGAEDRSGTSTITSEQLRYIAKRYLEGLRRHFPDTPHITDKMPGNFFHLGLIHMALPKATIIHASRDARDTCLSNYQLLFRKPIPFAYDLAELGRYHRLYERLMEHWRRTLPDGRFLTVRYEDLVCDLDNQARRILDHCGLPWDEGCIRFHENRRPVKTASLAQVRKPLYRTSVGRWRQYEPWLGPLLRELTPTNA